MNDKRYFHNYLTMLKDEAPNNATIELIESVREKFDMEFDAITTDELKALKRFPMQFVKRIKLDRGEWTTKLHIWAEQCVPEILKLDPILLAFRNSNGDSVLMSLVSGATGTHTDQMNYPIIKKILGTNMAYEDIDTDGDGNDVLVLRNAFDVLDIEGNTPLDYLIQIAFATETYANELPDEKLQMLIREFANRMDDNVLPQPEPKEELHIIDSLNEEEEIAPEPPSNNDGDD